MIGPMKAGKGWTASSSMAGNDIHLGRRIDSSELLPELSCCLK
jgi:hypothetical protein